MVERRLQRAYNWAYGSVSGAARMLPFMLRADHTHREPQLSKPLHGFLPILLETSEQFAKLAAETGDSLYAEASDALVAARGLLETAIASASTSDKAEFRRNLQKTIDALRAVKRRLHKESPIRYSIWLVNPIRHFPAKLA
jgi:hypothetical protein